MEDTIVLAVVAMIAAWVVWMAIASRKQRIVRPTIVKPPLRIFGLPVRGFVRIFLVSAALLSLVVFGLWDWLILEPREQKWIDSIRVGAFEPKLFNTPDKISAITHVQPHEAQSGNVDLTEYEWCSPYDPQVCVEVEYYGDEPFQFTLTNKLPFSVCGFRPGDPYQEINQCLKPGWSVLAIEKDHRFERFNITNNNYREEYRKNH